MPLSEKKRVTNKRYDDKTYKQVMFRLRIEDDADLLAEIEKSVAETGTKRTWIRDLHDNRYTKEQIIKVFDGFRGTLTPEIIERMLSDIER